MKKYSTLLWILLIAGLIIGAYFIYTNYQLAGQMAANARNPAINAEIKARAARNKTSFEAENRKISRSMI